MNKADKLLKPQKLKPGDKVAAITLSWGGAGTFPYRFEIGKKRLESEFGLQIIPTKHALKDASWIYNNPLARADDLMEAFLDPNIKGIISNIGGEDSIRILPFVDLEIIKQNPKIFMGFSDCTVTHFICYKAGLSSLYGPSVMTAFAENVKMHDYTIRGVKTNLFSNKTIGFIPENKEGWTTEFLDWANPENQNILRKLNNYVKWNFIGNTEQVAKGKLIGGCMEVLQGLNGTSLWPELTQWQDKILFFETSEEGAPPNAVLRFMRNLAAQSILGKLKGILFSKPGGRHIKESHFPEYDAAILKAFEEFSLPSIPIVTRMDFGHSDPMWILPYGALTEINPKAKSVTILENAVE
jgi:muramoyltetrapeptide carboxypeptidase LdcA involved in peptidoglycan recycling